VGVAGGHRPAGHRPIGELKSLGLADLWRPHVHVELELGVAPRDELADAGAGPGTHGEGGVIVGRGEQGGDAARAVAGDLGRRAVGVDEARGDVGVVVGRQPLDAVGAHALVAVAGTARERGQVDRCEPLLDEQEVVAAGGRLDEGHPIGAGPGIGHKAVLRVSAGPAGRR
jgi:hypothetical protein